MKISNDLIQLATPFAKETESNRILYLRPSTLHFGPLNDVNLALKCVDVNEVNDVTQSETAIRTT